MAPLPPTNTETWFIDYTTGRREHTFQVRTADNATPAAVDAAVVAFLNALDGVLCADWEVLRCRVRNRNSVLTFPITLPLVEAFSGSGPPLSAVNEPREMVFVGRGLTSGRRAELSLYGLTYATPEEYRLQDGSAPSIAAALTVLNAGGANIYLSIAGDKPVWYPYLNVNFNSYWEKRARLG